MTPSSSSPSAGERSGSPSLGDVSFGPGTFSARSNIKRLELDRKGSLGDLRARSSTPGATPNRSLTRDNGSSSKVTIDPMADATASPGQLSLTLRPRRADTQQLNGTTPPRTLTPVKSKTATRSPTVVDNDGEGSSEYICTPSIKELERFSPQELSRVENLKIERPGCGSLAWLEPVDLTSLESLSDLTAGQLVRIDSSGVELYQNMPYPQPGQELNSAALVTLCNVWPKDRSTGTRGPTSDEDALAHHRKELKKRLKKFQGEFVEYEQKEGRWVFKVPFFWDGERA